MLRESRRQAVLLRRHFPPRAGNLSHFGGVPTVPLGFTWPFVMQPDGRDRALVVRPPGRLCRHPRGGTARPDAGPRPALRVPGPRLGQPLGVVRAVRERGPRQLRPGTGADRPAEGVLGARCLGLAATRRRLAEPAAVLEPPARVPRRRRDPREATTTSGTSGRARSTWSGRSPRSTARWCPRATSRTPYDEGVLVRPYATFPHDWQAVRIATGLLQARHLRPSSAAQPAHRGGGGRVRGGRPALVGPRRPGGAVGTALPGGQRRRLAGLPRPPVGDPLLPSAMRSTSRSTPPWPATPTRRPGCRPRPWPSSGSGTRSAARVRGACTPTSTR